VRILILVVLAAGVTFAQSAAPRQLEIENTAAFARLYGVVRHFYPSDAAALLDWNRFAVYGVGRARNAPTAAALQVALEEMFAPLGPGIVVGTKLPPAPAIGAADGSLVAWRYRGPGGLSTAAGPYTAGRTNRAGLVTPADANTFVAMAQSIPAAAYRGKTMRLTARARVPDPAAAGWAGLWLRVDRPDQPPGFFDNMQDRPIRSTEWREYVIEGPIADDATNIVMGPLASGGMSAEFDAFEVSALVDGKWTPVSITNGGFEDAGGTAGWVRANAAPTANVTVATTAAAEGTRHLRLTASTATQAPPAQGAAPSNAHVDVDLGSGLTARVRLSLTDAEARASAPALEGLRKAIASVADPNGRSDAEVRLADVVVAWNILRHFYPYWQEAGVDWDARLRPQLAAAAAAQARAGHHDALRMLVADARDGHGSVADTVAGERRALLPIRLALVEGQVIISASAAGDAPVGSVVTAIRNRSSSELLEEGMRLSSGTAQWRQSRTLQELILCVRDSTVTIALQLADGRPRDVALPCTAQQFVAEPRPEPITQVATGTWYVDLTRAMTAQVRPMLPALAAASGIVFDLRGYPTDAGAFLLGHLIDAPENDRWMHVPHITGPFGQLDGWQSFGWNLQPATPYLPARRVFLTDGRAISYAESVMGYVADRKLATIIGGPTAGTNGNVVTAATPGGFAMAFTGMRVTGHDGRTPFHLVGVPPHIPLQPTLAGLRAGRDELLERALEVLRGP
jgi:hypothetical protein